MTLGTTVDALVERVRRDSLIASRGPMYTVGSGGYTAGAVTITLAETFTHIGQGSVLTVDYEAFYVKEATAATKTVSVIPGYFGTTQANHAAGAVVEVDARFPRPALLDHAHQEILSWGNELWRVSAVNLTLNTNEHTYDLAGITGDIYFLLDVRQKPLGDTSQFWNFSWTGDAWPHLDGRLLRRMDTAEFASGTALQLRNKPRHAGVARVAVAQPFDLSAFISSTDLISAVGLNQGMLQVIEFGTKARALGANVIGRADWRTGSMARAAEEVSALDTVRAVQVFSQMRDLELARAANNLRSDFPYRVI